ncbi:unnamed protein product [Adineta steineri]|uniref:Uncharacterized protein n=1 Tax=Adineta steineri TaxID=433720 RepID=A0A815JYD0_9BILA|nr:unnamed protein product [Adineta steineri]CAF1163677.1 unnamed protein product [Adineta steineri]CAF1236196.1 unnamed protein product [Adineta steineri]CAF1243447.1 unnamed protein product [Adineta steineri]CAF1250563.1 unnamed protein product [Adineta steineri]
MVSFFKSKSLWEPDRLVCKSGRVDIFIQNRPIVWSRTCADWYSNLISASWISVLALIMAVFLISWTLFALVWYVIAFYNGDFQPDHLRPNTDHRPCLVNVGNSFLAFFLFSLETQHTIGYGYRHVNDECKAGVILLMIQSACGALITIYVGGIVFNKLARPKQRMKVLTFSERAVVAPRDGQLCFMFKVGSNIITQLTRPAIRVIYYKLQPTQSGDVIPVENFDMAVHPSNTNLMLLCPLVIEHKIDQSSPLYPISPIKLYNSEGNGSDAFEVVVIIEGTMESTGDACQYRTSYKPREILWGFRFKQTSFTFEDGKINFDMTSFEEFEPVNMDIYIGKGKGPKLFAPVLSHKIHRRRRRKRRSTQEHESPVRVNA